MLPTLDYEGPQGVVLAVLACFPDQGARVCTSPLEISLIGQGAMVGYSVSVGVYGTVGSPDWSPTREYISGTGDCMDWFSCVDLQTATTTSDHLLIFAQPPLMNLTIISNSEHHQTAS